MTKWLRRSISGVPVRKRLDRLRCIEKDFQGYEVAQRGELFKAQGCSQTAATSKLRSRRLARVGGFFHEPPMNVLSHEKQCAIVGALCEPRRVWLLQRRISGVA